MQDVLCCSTDAQAKNTQDKRLLCATREYSHVLRTLRKCPLIPKLRLGLSILDSDNPVHTKVSIDITSASGVQKLAQFVRYAEGFVIPRRTSANFYSLLDIIPLLQQEAIVSILFIFFNKYIF